VNAINIHNSVLITSTVNMEAVSSSESVGTHLPNYILSHPRS
jgi:hypothetical protein